MVEPGWWHEAAREAYARGAKQAAIARIYKVSPAAVWNVIHPEKKKEAQQRDYEKHREKRLAQHKAYRLRKRETASA